MMKELLVMVSEDFRKEYNDTTGKIYRNLNSGVESFMIEDGIVTVIYTEKLWKIAKLLTLVFLVVILLNSINYKTE